MKLFQSFDRLFLFLCCVAVLTACSSSSDTSPASGDSTPPLLVSALPADGTIGPQTVISVTFSETMDRSSLRVGGDLAAEAETGIWFDASVTDDATSVRPLTAWSSGTGRTLTFDATDLAGNPSATVSLTFDVDTAPPLATVIEPFDRILTATQAIIVEFNEPMDENLNLGGSIGDASSGGTYLLVGGSPLQLRIEPSTEWPRGRDANLSLTVQDANQNSATIEFLFDVVDGIVHASPSGNDSNSGAASQPLQTLQAAVDMAINTVLTGAATTAAAVRVGEGLYTADSGGVGGPVILGALQGEGGVSLYGGYSSDFSSRDPATRISTLQDTSTATAGAPGTNNDPNRAIHAGTWSDERNLIDGMTIRGSDQGDYSAAVYLKGGSIEVRNCIIQGGGSNGGNRPSVWSYGALDNQGNGLSLRNNIIHGGVAPDTSAVHLNASDRALIEGNRIDGGGRSSANSDSFGIFMLSTNSVVIRNNQIDGGAAATRATGVVVADASLANTDPIVQNNTINASSNTESRGILLNIIATPTFENNIVSASTGISQYCFDDGGGNADPVFFRNNVLFGCQTALYRDEGSTNLTNIVDVNNLMDTVSSGNVSTDPVFADRDGADDDLKTFADNDWQLTAASPASVTQGGLDLSSDFDTDFDGNTRTVPWSIGAYEQD